jgi:NAD(P)H-flavin reductase/hemoglobin-like flavoprotein
MSSDAQLLKESLALIEPVRDKVVGYFYATLFVNNPKIRAMFPLTMDHQRDRLFRALTSTVQGIDRPEQLIPMLHQLARDHRKFGVRPEHYDAVGSALIGAVKEYSYGDWTAEIEAAWIRAFGMIARTMIDAVAQPDGHPDFWYADIVGLTRRTDDIAILQLRPDQPYPFESGQYTSLETPLVPRVWRSYSMANAPRRDGILEIHVRQIGAGWVSGALVRKHRVGDTVRLGPPRGATVLDRESPRDIVCVGGGTGLAPMKALVDEARRWNTTRRMHLFFGVRRREDLYDVQALQEFATRYRWLNVITAVSHDPEYPGEQGMLHDVIARYGDWSNHDVYLSGSPDMVRATAGRFRELGVPAELIRYDVFGDVDYSLPI